MFHWNPPKYRAMWGKLYTVAEVETWKENSIEQEVFELLTNDDSNYEARLKDLVELGVNLHALDDEAGSLVFDILLDSMRPKKHLESLINLGFDVNFTYPDWGTNCYRSLLSHAIEFNAVELVEVLLELGASPIFLDHRLGTVVDLLHSELSYKVSTVGYQEAKEKTLQIDKLLRKYGGMRFDELMLYKYFMERKYFGHRRRFNRSIARSVKLWRGFRLAELTPCSVHYNRVIKIMMDLRDENFNDPWRFQEYKWWSECDHCYSSRGFIKSEIEFREDRLSVFIYASYEGELAGFAQISESAYRERKDLAPWICDLYVIERFRKQGLGKKLCRELEMKARELGYKKIYLLSEEWEESFYFQQSWQGEELVTLHRDKLLLMSKHLDRFNLSKRKMFSKGISLKKGTRRKR